VDPVVIDRGSGHKASTTFPANSPATTNSNVGKSIVEKVIVIDGVGEGFIYAEVEVLG
jgi:hypothetical protein